MSTHVEPRTKATSAPETDPWFYGWRYVTRTEADGTETTVQVPLTEEDVLHPQEDDFIVQNDDHTSDCYYLKTVLDGHLADRPGVHVFHDHRMDWGVEGVKAHGPDFAVVQGFPDDWDGQRGTFCLAEYAARTLLVIEVTSPTTRKGDLDAKVIEYYRAGIPYYAIVDRQYERGDKPRLFAYRPGEREYVLVEADAEGWLALEPIGLWLRLEDGRLVCRDASGRYLLDPLEAINALEDAETRAEEAEALAQTETQARQTETQARRQAEAQTRAEAQARQHAEELARAEAQARQTETQARLRAEELARAEAQARLRAEELARAEAQARQAIEERLRQLEAEMNRLRGQS